MKKIFILLLIMMTSNLLRAQGLNKDLSIQFDLGIAQINYRQVENALQAGFSMSIPTKNKMTYQIGYSYFLGSHIKKDRRDFSPQVFNYNSHIQQSQINGAIAYPLFTINNFNMTISTGLSLNFMKESFVNNIFEKELFQNQPYILVSESTFQKKFQIGSISALEAKFKLNRVSPGLGLHFQFQQAYQFFSPTLFLKYQL